MKKEYQKNSAKRTAPTVGSVKVIQKRSIKLGEARKGKKFSKKDYVDIEKW